MLSQLVLERPPLDAIVSLWISALRQAVLDAVGAERSPFVRTARRWLLNGGRDRMDVCCRANLDAGAIAERVRDIAEVRSWRPPKGRAQWDRGGALTVGDSLSWNGWPLTVRRCESHD
ncbi:hypothetical protein [Azospirillum canadense]|uniref:hypothetical protein n=1 Tax=Azospirillum canadense TaxID=403962 RepID=UPI0022268878|nr:hypothetical protein [Azospirillum canadense]MCW2240514.1 hypothetical protein [Azospirillum canadense]